MKPQHLVSALAAIVTLSSGLHASEPVIDMHVHAYSADTFGPPPSGACMPPSELPVHDPAEPWPRKFGQLMASPPCEDPAWSFETDEELRDHILSELKRLNVYAVVSGQPDRLNAWSELAGDRLIPALALNITWPDAAEPAAIADAVDEGTIHALGEVTNQYAGIAADDPSMAPYWQMAEDKDLPVLIHMGPGPPGAAMIYKDMHISHASALHLEPVLARHPGLRICIAHAGWPFVDDLIAMMYMYPQLYVEVGVLQMAIPRQEYYRFLKQLVDAGLHQRVMFGSDQMTWRGMIAEGIDAIKEAPFLTHEQKRDILYNNAARFLRMDPAGDAGNRH